MQQLGRPHTVSKQQGQQHATNTSIVRWLCTKLDASLPKLSSSIARAFLLELVSGSRKPYSATLMVLMTNKCVLQWFDASSIIKPCNSSSQISKGSHQGVHRNKLCLSANQWISEHELPFEDLHSWFQTSTQRYNMKQLKHKPFTFYDLRWAQVGSRQCAKYHRNLFKGLQTLSQFSAEETSPTLRTDSPSECSSVGRFQLKKKGKSLNTLPGQRTGKSSDTPTLSLRGGCPNAGRVCGSLSPLPSSAAHRGVGHPRRRRNT